MAHRHTKESYFEVNDLKQLMCLNIGISTILECLRIAEIQGAVPEIDRGWWVDAFFASELKNTTSIEDFLKGDLYGLL
ncbi:MAG: hypothetical protein FWE05_10580 [Defluviitaleaceae bacterium]|nr:hypothetical protein [Defluviitaleaceae bacterium]